MKKAEKIFHIISITLLAIFIIFFATRAIYYKYNYSKSTKYSSVLYDRIMQHENNYELISELVKTNNTYYYTGKAKNNYVNYKGLIWRIIKIDEEKSITLILDNSITNLPYEYINYWLNDIGEKNSGIFYNSLYKNTSDNNVDNFMHTNKNFSCEPINYKTIYLLNEDDYNNTGGIDGFINNHTDFWITNGEKKYVDITGKIETEDMDNTHNVRPVIVINGNIEANKGNGTSDDPYYIKRSKAEVTSQLEINSYVLFNDTLWRVLSNSDNKIKLTSEECVKDDDDKCLNIEFSDDNNEINKYNKNSVIYYLNNTYYDSIKYKEYLEKGKFYIGKLDSNNYSNIYTEKTNLKVGLMTLTDPHSFEITNTFLLTGDTDSNLSIYTAQDDHAFETIVTEKAYLRPVIYIKDNIKIVKGTGTYKSPYRLEGDYEEE